MYSHVMTGHDLWRKAYPAAGADRARREAQILRVAAHPGIVELRGVAEEPDGSVVLSLSRLPGPDLTTAMPETPALGTALAAAVGAVVADLHAVGIAHGALEREHVVLDADGAPVLCGFGDAVLDADSQARRADVAGLIRLASTLIPGGTGSAAGRKVNRAIRRCRSADAVARRLAEIAPRLNPAEAASRPASRSRVVRIVFAVAAIVAVGGAWWALGRPSPRAPVVSASSASCPVVDAGCAPVASRGGVIKVGSARFQAGTSGDVVVLGRWRCTPIGLPAVLRPSTGQVWVFDRWPTGVAGVPGRLVGTVTDAASLRVVAGRCDRIEVVRAGALAPVRLTP